PKDQLLGTHIGAIAGPGAVYKGTINTPQAPNTTVPIALMAASNGRLTILATVVSDPQNVSFIYQQADGNIMRRRSRASAAVALLLVLVLAAGAAIAIAIGPSRAHGAGVGAGSSAHG